jgi:hypothetical protein
MKRRRFSIKMSLLLQLCTSAMKGWFDAFRYDGGPTLYSFNNRTAVTGDVTLITFLTIFCTLYVAFLIIFPGIRKEVGATFSNYVHFTQLLKFRHNYISQSIKIHGGAGSDESDADGMHH